MGPVPQGALRWGSSTITLLQSVHTRENTCTYGRGRDAHAHWTPLRCCLPNSPFEPRAARNFKRPARPVRGERLSFTPFTSPSTGATNTHTNFFHPRS